MYLINYIEIVFPPINCSTLGWHFAVRFSDAVAALFCVFAVQQIDCGLASITMQNPLEHSTAALHALCRSFRFQSHFEFASSKMFEFNSKCEPIFYPSTKNRTESSHKECQKTQSHAKRN